MSAKTQTTAGPAAAFAADVSAAAGADLLVCLQCRKCTNGCPVAGRVDIKPHEIVRLVQLGERDEVLSSRMLWECTSCETCVSRCPQQVDLPAIIDALRQMARAQHKAPAAVTVPVFNDIFLGLVQKRGRMYEAGLMTAYKFRDGHVPAGHGQGPDDAEKAQARAAAAQGARRRRTQAPL